MIFAPLFLSGLVAVAFAEAIPAAPAFTKTLVSKCMTASGLKPVATLATSTRGVKLTTTITSISTSTPIVTVTPDVVTEETVELSTSTVTETASQVTDTLIVTTTFFDTENEWESSTVFETQTNTITETSTMSPTMTIMPSAGFTPIYSEIASKGKVPAKRDDALVARAGKKNMLSIKNGKVISPPARYPVRVQCVNVVYIVYTKVKVVPATAKSTVTAVASTTISTTTSIVEETTTEAVQDASTTSVVSETSTISLTSTNVETSTVTTSTTTTSIVPAATPYYAACGQDNLPGSVSGSGIDTVWISGDGYGFVSSYSAYDCCVYGINVGSGGSFYVAADNTCYTVPIASAKCDAKVKTFYIEANGSLAPGEGFVVSNGNCGSGSLIS